MAVVVGTLADSYARHLRPVPPAGPGVCRTCHGAADEGFAQCYSCQGQREILAGGVADVVVPIALSVKRERLAVDLWRYKNSPNPLERRLLTLRLAAVLWRFLAEHEACLAGVCAVSEFGCVTGVPSAAGRAGTHPLDVLVRLVGGLRDRYRPLLAATGAEMDRRARGDRFRALSPLRGSAVLLIDDTWTTGAHAQSAAAALRAADAGCVAVVVLGRRFDPAFREAEPSGARFGGRAFSWGTCAAEPAGSVVRAH